MASKWAFGTDIEFPIYVWMSGIDPDDSQYSLQAELMNEENLDIGGYIGLFDDERQIIPFVEDEIVCVDMDFPTHESRIVDCAGVIAQ